MKASVGRRAGGLRPLAVVMMLAAVLAAAIASPARADNYDIQKTQALYGNLNQNAIPNGGQYLCGPTAATNSFVYLENAYPAVYDRSLVPDNNPANGAHDQAELISTAQALAGAGYMNSKQNLQGAGGGSGTWDDMFIYGKQKYIEDNLPGKTLYAAQMLSTWAWPGPVENPRPADEIPPIARPAWVQDQTIPTWQFLYNELVACEDVEILIIDGDWGHFLTVTGFSWIDVNNDLIVQLVENAQIAYIDPATGNPGLSAMFQQILGGQIFVSYGNYQNAQLVMTVSESVPEPASLSLLALGALWAAAARRRPSRTAE